SPRETSSSFCTTMIATRIFVVLLIAVAIVEVAPSLDSIEGTGFGFDGKREAGQPSKRQADGTGFYKREMAKRVAPALDDLDGKGIGGFEGKREAGQPSKRQADGTGFYKREMAK
ncbi:hypothetical protein PMAYCL1PPCAC_04285, partial [Pristionchus mayeri]